MAIYGSRPGGESEEDPAADRRAPWGDSAADRGGQRPDQGPPVYRPEEQGGYDPPAPGGPYRSGHQQASDPGAGRGSTYGAAGGARRDGADYGASAGFGSPVTPPPGYGPPMSGPPMSGPPMSGPPMSGPPMSGPPMSGPPMSGPPMSGPPAYGPSASGPSGYGPPSGPGAPASEPRVAGPHDYDPAAYDPPADARGPASGPPAYDPPGRGAASGPPAYDPPGRGAVSGPPVYEPPGRGPARSPSTYGAPPVGAPASGPPAYDPPGRAPASGPPAGPASGPPSFGAAASGAPVSGPHNYDPAAYGPPAGGAAAYGPPGGRAPASGPPAGPASGPPSYGAASGPHDYDPAAYGPPGGRAPASGPPTGAASGPHDYDPAAYGPPGGRAPASGPPAPSPPQGGPSFGAPPGMPHEPETDHWSTGGEDWDAPARERAVPMGAAAAAAPPARRSFLNRTTVIVAAVLAVLVGAGGAGAAYLTSNDDNGPGGTPPAAGSQAPGAPGGAASSSAPSGAEQISMSATGDIVMGMAPNGLPPNNGKGLFDPVKSLLEADLRMGNLEQTITNDTGVGKCSAASAGKTCFAFRTPPATVQNLVDGGFHLMNLANNHANDFGDAGLKNTTSALEGVGIKHTGAPGQITVTEVKGVKVAVVGFASYKWSNLCSDIPASTKIITAAAGQADIVVVQVHMGAEGAGMTHVKPGTEIFLGEDRCDPIKFSHAVVDAGADLVVGHGPHVVRGMEFYKGRLIAYSLGNFLGYKALGTDGVVGVTAVIKVDLKRDGSWVGGNLISTKMQAPGTAHPDPAKQALKLIGDLSKADFPSSGAKFGPDGAISQ